jgi:hypothetical protein
VLDETVSVAALMGFSLPVVAPGTPAQQEQICPPQPSLESHFRIANGTSIRWYSNLIDKVDFEGDIQIALVPDSNDAQSAHVKVLSLREEGEPQYSRFTLELAEGDDAPESTLKCTQANPSRMKLTYVLNLVITAQSSDGAEVGQIRTKTPAVQSVELNEWPPNGEIFQLQRPMEFVFPDGEFAATIEKYPTQERGRVMQVS